MKKLLACLLLLSLLCPSALADSCCEPLSLTNEQRYAAGLFLSNFTEIGCLSISENSPDIDLVDFAHDHLWFNDYSAFEFGEYAGSNNCRVSDARIQEIVSRYFRSAPAVALDQTRFDYDSGYYYHCETGGWLSGGFAHVISLCPAGEKDTYFVSFAVFGGGESWENGDIRLSAAEAQLKYGAPRGYGSALVYAGDLADRSTYSLLSFAQMP